MKRTIIVAIILMAMLIPLTVKAEDEERSTYHLDGGFYMGLNNNGWEMHAGAAWMPIEWVGAKLTLGVCSEIYEIGDWGREYDYDYDNDYYARFMVKPSLVLKSPAIAHWKAQDGSFHLFAEPGATIATYGSSTRGCEWLYWHVRTGVRLEIDRLVFTLSYNLSNFNLLDGGPNAHHSNYEDKSNSHTVSIGFGFKY